MKTYRIEAGGKSYTLAGLTDDVKTDIVDFVQARERMALNRQFKKAYIDAEAFTLANDSLNAMGFASTAVVTYISTPDGKKHLYRAMLENGGKCPEKSEDVIAAVDAIYKASLEDGHPASFVIENAIKDAYPKETTPPPSMVPADATH